MNSINLNNKKIIPSKVVCIGRNYVEHIKELGNETPDEMVIFNKPNSSIQKELFFFKEDTRYEGEICLLIEKNSITGIGFGLDLTHANIQNKMKTNSWPWERSKAFDGSCVLSDFIVFDGDIKNIHFELYINDNLVQHANHELMIYKPHEMLEEILSFMTIEDGDIIMTGTPKGVATYKKGDNFHTKVFEKNHLLLEKKWVVQ